MSNRIDGDNLFTKQGVRVKNFNRDRFSKAYLNKLDNNINRFIRGPKHGNANRSDVVHYLETKGFVNEVLKGNVEFTRLINSKILADRAGLSINLNTAAVSYILSVARYDPKYRGRRVMEATIMSDLKSKNIMPKARTREFNNTLKAMVMRHNAEFTKDTLDKFRTGSRRYTLSWTALVWDEQAKGDKIRPR